MFDIAFDNDDDSIFHLRRNHFAGEQFSAFLSIQFFFCSFHYFLCWLTLPLNAVMMRAMSLRKAAPSLTFLTLPPVMLNRKFQRPARFSASSFSSSSVFFCSNS